MVLEVAGVAVVLRAQSQCREKSAIQVVAQNWTVGAEAMGMKRFVIEIQPGVFFVVASGGVVPHWTSHLNHCRHFASRAQAEEVRQRYVSAYPNARVLEFSVDNQEG